MPRNLGDIMQSESNQAQAVASGATPLVRGGILVAAIGALSGLGFWAIGQTPAPTPTSATISEPAASLPEPQVSIAPQPQPQPQPEPEPEHLPDAVAIAAPSITTWAVGQDGVATIAGLGQGGSKIEILLDGAFVGQTTATRSGEFALVTTLAANPNPSYMSLRMTLADGQVVLSKEGVALGPIGQTAVPAAVLVSDEGAVVLQGLGDADLSISAISYAEAGQVHASGLAPQKAVLRVYLDHNFVKEIEAEAGQWQISLPEVGAGDHILRLDQMGEGNQVTTRVEQSFTREPSPAVEAPAPLAASPTDKAPLPAKVSITVEKGHSLWAIAREQLGDGILYVQVFEANKDKILDADLIYPGQVFELPTR